VGSQNLKTRFTGAEKCFDHLTEFVALYHGLKRNMKDVFTLFGATKKLITRLLHFQSMKIRRYTEMTKEEIHELLSRHPKNLDEIKDSVAKIIKRVSEEGDRALFELERELDHCELTTLRVEEREFEEAEKAVEPELKRSIELAIENVKNYQKRLLPPPIWLESFANGIIAGEKVSAIQSVGLYVPRGKGSFPSVMIMLGVPARVAGVKRIVVATPPERSGKVDEKVLFVCNALGIKEVYKMGGAQAIAALALGTQSIKKVSKILGPGSAYVNVAKQLLAGRVDIGLIAGPSESVVVADETQNPLNVALDLLQEAEHGSDSTSLLLTTSQTLVEEVRKEVEQILSQLDEPRKGFVETVLKERGGAIVFETMEEIVNFVNEFAPEHLVLDVKDAFSLLQKIENAGEILIGPNTPISAGNYIAGPNAVLPTGGFAKSMSPLSVRDFLKTTSILSLSSDALLFYKEHIERLAKSEGFPLHALSAVRRVPVYEDSKGEFRVLSASERSISVVRESRESKVSLTIYAGERDLNLKANISTPLEFLNHMIETIAWRSGFNIRVSVNLEGYKLMHVVAEDTGITMGYAFYQLVQRGFSKGIEGCGSSIAVIDEARASVSLSFEGRSLYVSNLKTSFERVEDMLSADLHNFLSGFAQGGRCTLHVVVESGSDPHHVWEAVFRAFGEALRGCFKQNSFRRGTTPGVKGV